MNLSIKATIYQAILEDKWVEVSYTNTKQEKTNYYIGIKDVDYKNGRIICDIFNVFKSNRCIEDTNRRETFIKISGINKAKILEHSYYPTPQRLVKRVEEEPELASFLEVQTLDNNILRYLSDCYRLDNDPFIKDTVTLDGVDQNELRDRRSYTLDDKQFAVLMDHIFRARDRFEAEEINRYGELAMNLFSIDLKDKQYVVAYRRLFLDFKTRTLKMADETTINKSFLITEEKKVTLGQYLDINPDEFCTHFDERKREFIELIQENYRDNEKTNTRPSIFLLKRKTQKGVDEAFEAISEMDSAGQMNVPVKAFFGRNKTRPLTNKDPNIVIFNKNKINIDQMRVVYNSMANHITYVKGPPGTGKTETIFNVLLSAYANDKTVLVCSNNNHPVNDIFDKMTKSLIRENKKSGNAERIVFPIIRLGNNEALKETVVRLRTLLSYAEQFSKAKINAEWTNNSKTSALNGFKELKELLIKYEERSDLEDKIQKLEQLKTIVREGAFASEIDKQSAIQKEKLNSFLSIKEEDVSKYAISASESSSFQNFIYYSALSRLKKLVSPVNKDLREIIDTDDIEAATIALNKHLKDDKNLRRFLDIFPIVVTTNLSAEKLGSAKPHFDLCVMDEAGQCNVASSLIPIIRARDLLLVGDTNQLQPVTVIETNVNDKLMERYHIKPEYDYVRNSILSTMLRKDSNSKSVLLSYHYRCAKRIAGFVNQRFYEDKLKLFNENQGQLTYVDVANTPRPDRRNAYSEEAMEIVNIIKKNNYKDVGIITPFVNQAALINDYLRKEGISDIKAGTVHTLQGSERSVIILSSCLSYRTARKTMDWIKDNHELINVAVTRAKEQLVFVGDKKAIDALSGDEKSDIKTLSDYVFKNGEIIVPKSIVSISTDFSNNSASEKQFFETITPYFNKRGTKFRIDRNVKVIDAIKGIRQDDLERIGHKEFDVIVQARSYLSHYRTVVVFEIDGGEHIGSKLTAERDRAKEQICHDYGIRLIRISNNQVKDYELIISLFECIIKNIPDIEKVDRQMSLFDEA